MAKAVQLKDKAGNKVYATPYFPIGSIYLTVGNYNPSTYFGGKWEKISGGYLWGCNSAIDNNLMDSSAGCTKSFDTALTIEQMPKHSHNAVSTDGTNDTSILLYPFQMITQNHCKVDSNVIRPAGGGKGHSHDIPYIGVWVWKRIA